MFAGTTGATGAVQGLDATHKIGMRAWRNTKRPARGKSTKGKRETPHYARVWGNPGSMLKPMPQHVSDMSGEDS